jgi:hypothetical protein
MLNYWVVGAMWGGKADHDQSEKFIRRGYWFLGWEDKDQPAQAKLRDKIKRGDRIAIKKMLGRGSPNIAIRALGVVKEIDKDDKRVYIDWFVKGLKREVSSKGAYKSIHDPFAENDDWVKEVFHI